MRELLARFGPRRAHRAGERGQILVLFTLSLVAIIGMVGLILDGGSAFAQRRVEQNAADLASIAGANAYLNCTPNCTIGQRSTAAVNAAIAAATRNGYTNGVNGATVPTPTVTLLATGARVTVSLTAPHPNTFARIYGQNSWDVSVTAAADSGTIDTATGAAPWTMSILAFNADGSPKYGPGNPHAFGDGNGDYPNGATDISWTDFNGSNNVNTNEVRNIINGTNVVTATFGFGQYLGQHNQGNHTALYDDVEQYLLGATLPVPIVGAGNPNCTSPTTYQNGCFKGWALFTVTGVDKQSKQITGYFDPEGFVAQPLSVGACPPNPVNPCGTIVSGSFDQLVVKLVQ